MILCVDTKALKTSAEVQTNVKLEDIINNHTKYYDSVEEALKDNYVPLDFSVSIRTLYSNLVVEIDAKTEDGNDKKMYYTNMSQVQQFIHKGYDLIMYLTSIGVMMNVNYSLGFDEVMLEHSQFVPIGLYNPDPTVINPIIYSHILISDVGAKEFDKYLKKGRRFLPISDMKKEGNLYALLDTLVITKEENIDEKHNDNN